MSISAQLAQSRLEYFSSAKPERIGAPPATSAEKDALFGADGLTFRDVLDAINPLNHIPIVSDLFARATEHKPSDAAKLAGGTLLGGPIGFIASLANVIFESATGESPTEAAFAALSKTPAAPGAPESLGSFAELAPSQRAVETKRALASAAVPALAPARAATILDLYGASPASAHASYRSAQLRPYLNDVTVSRVL